MLTFQYTRYADDWIVITNADETTCENIKNVLKEWLAENLKLRLSEEKTKITNFQKDPVCFLGFSMFDPGDYQIKTITPTKKMNVKKYQKRTNLGPKIGIDIERIIKRFKDKKIINDKIFPTHVPSYVIHKPWEIVMKYKQIAEGIFGYYYHTIATKSRLNIIYYWLRYSCYKTLAGREKSTIRKIIAKYGQSVTIHYEEIVHSKTNGTEKIRKKISFPTYGQLMENQGRISRKKTQIKIDRKLKKKKAIFSTDPFLYEPDPLNIKTNLRTGYKLHKICSICRCEGTRVNPLETHHVKKLNNARTKGFTEIMKSLNRKTIVCCRKCHRKIHKGEYDSLSLKEVYHDLIEA